MTKTYADIDRAYRMVRKARAKGHGASLTVAGLVIIVKIHLKKSGKKL